MYVRLTEKASEHMRAHRFVEAADMFEQAAALMGDHKMRSRVLCWAREARERAKLERVKASSLHIKPRPQSKNQYHELGQ
jgi:hypothetical protein